MDKKVRRVITKKSARKPLGRRGPEKPDFRFLRRCISVFTTARELVRFPREPNSRMIFIGTGMRPLFEAVRAMNEHFQEWGRKDFRYVIAPPRRMDRDPLVESMARFLTSRGIVSPGKKVYYLVDLQFTGGTFDFFSKVIQRIVPDAQIHRITQEYEHTKMNMRKVARGIVKGESFFLMMFKKSWDSQKGEVVLAPYMKKRLIPNNRYYLLFQLALQKWMRKMRKDNERIKK
ncbi:MAG: hypothetical protein V1776_04635 [Candidatus Diapherotrites archaeon]